MGAVAELDLEIGKGVEALLTTALALVQYDISFIKDGSLINHSTTGAASCHISTFILTFAGKVAGVSDGLVLTL